VNVRLVSRAGSRGWRIALLLCLLAALAWQSCLTQTHLHADRAAGTLSSLGTVRAAAAGDDRSAPDTPATCPICQEAALSGSYVATGPVLLALPAVATAWYPPAVSRPSRRDLRSHAWHSRAPPARSIPSTV
jgi:hypothetical protein